MMYIPGSLLELTDVNDRSAMYVHRTYLITLVLPICGMILLLPQPSPAQERENDSSVPQQLQPGQTLQNQLAAKARQVFYLTIEPASTIIVSILQQEGSVSVKYTPPDGMPEAPRTNDAGQTSRIQFTLTGPSTGRCTFEITGYRATEPAKYSLTVSSLRASAVSDPNTAEAEALLAQAEWSRRKGNRDSWPKALEEYDRAADFFRSQGYPALTRAALVGKARLLIFKLNQYPAGGKAADDAVAVDSSKDDLPGQGLAWKTLGSAHYFHSASGNLLGVR